MNRLLAITMIVLAGCGPRVEFPGPGNADFSVQLGSGFDLVRSSSENIQIHGPNQLAIPSRVTRVAWDDRFILAQQQELTTQRYWIIEHSTAQIYGPYDEGQFLDKRQSLDVPTNLELRDVYEHRK